MFIFKDGVIKNNQVFDYVELVVEDNHLIEQKRFSGENSVSILLLFKLNFNILVIS